MTAGVPAAEGPPVLPARTVEEAREYVWLQECACGAVDGWRIAPVDPADPVVDATCDECGDRLEYRLDLTEPAPELGGVFRFGDGPSPLVDAGGWVRVVDKHYDTAWGIRRDVGDEPMDHLTTVVLVRSLLRAEAAALEALRCLPDGADRVTDRAFVLPPGRQPRPCDPRLFDRDMVSLAPVKCRELIAELVDAFQTREGVPTETVERLCDQVLPYGTRHTGEPVPARTVAEAETWAGRIPCVCGSASGTFGDSPLEVGDEVLTRLFGTCPDCGRLREVLFRNVTDDRKRLPAGARWSWDDRPSPLFDAGMFVGIWLLQTDLAGSARSAQEVPEPPGWLVGYRLKLAAGALDEALKFVPPGEDQIPEAALWEPTSLAMYAESPETFTRTRLTELRDAAWQRVAALPEEDEDDEDDDEPDPQPDLGVGPDGPLRPRSTAERRLYIDLHPCVCGEIGYTIETGTETQAADQILTMRYVVSCDGCGRARRIEFVVPPDRDSANPFTRWAADPAPSRLIDAGQWAMLADGYAAQADAAGSEQWRISMLLRGAHPDAAVEQLRARSAAAVDEVLKFLPPGADRLPDDAFWTAEGTALRRESPARFDRAALEAERADRRRHLAAARW